ncbi:MAG TPA: alpha/beta hydrolase [Flavisolibacter sp.]|nr:alpha/beta hydrolase [Flavisolibacter sp.]
MTGKTKRRLFRIAKLIVLLYIAVGVLAYVFQEKLLFHPAPLPPEHRFAFDQPYEEINLAMPGGNLNIIRFAHAGTKKGLVVFFHGNKNNVEHYKKYAPLFTSRGYELWMPDYPGFGKSTGERSEAILYEQALMVYELAAEGGDSITIYGKSLGTGIAAYVASRRACTQLVLETPYYSIAELAKSYFRIYPFMPAPRYTFPTHSYLAGVKAPVTIFHGTEDEVIPYSQAARLAKKYPRIRFFRIENGQHNNLFDFASYQAGMDSLLIN